MSAQESVHVEDRGQCQVPSPVASHLTTCDRVSPQSSSLFQLDRPANKPVLFLFPSPTDVSAMPSFACRCWGSEFRSCDLNAKHFTN